MSSLDGNRLIRAIADLRAAGRKTLIPFITAGAPDLETTEVLLAEFERRGVTICELGIPFSDPIADGPTIQHSYTQALERGITSDDIFQMVRHYRQSGGKLALVAMVSYSIVYRHGAERYLADLSKVGFDGLIVPDMSLEEAPALEQLAAKNGLANVMLIAPTTPKPRRLQIAQHSRGFIYFVSVSGITGERNELPAETIAAVAELHKHTDNAICVGFGISNPEMVKTVCEVADGAIVGSAIVHRISDAKPDVPRDQLARTIGQFVADLLAPIR